MNDLLNEETKIAYEPTEATPLTRACRRKPMKKAKPTHYKVICISMYTRDIDELDAKVRELKRRGMTKMSKSELIRLALSRLDVSALAG